jgi:hypothetical protein
MSMTICYHRGKCYAVPNRLMSDFYWSLFEATTEQFDEKFGKYLLNEGQDVELLRLEKDSVVVSLKVDSTSYARTIGTPSEITGIILHNMGHDKIFADAVLKAAEMYKNKLQ